MNMHTVYLCTGSNLGDRLANMEEAAMFIGFNIGSVVKTSGIYESEPWQMDGAPAFLNQILVVETELTIHELFQEIYELEEFYGRERSHETYLSRQMDVDVLFYDKLVLHNDKVIIPHPRLHLRKFVLQPLAEIAPALIHPVLEKSISELLKECEDKGLVAKI